MTPSPKRTNSLALVEAEPTVLPLRRFPPPLLLLLRAPLRWQQLPLHRKLTSLRKSTSEHLWTLRRGLVQRLLVPARQHPHRLGVQALLRAGGPIGRLCRLTIVRVCLRVEGLIGHPCLRGLESPPRAVRISPALDRTKPLRPKGA